MEKPRLWDLNGTYLAIHILWITEVYFFEYTQEDRMESRAKLEDGVKHYILKHQTGLKPSLH